MTGQEATYYEREVLPFDRIEPPSAQALNRSKNRYDEIKTYFINRWLGPNYIPINDKYADEKTENDNHQLLQRDARQSWQVSLCSYEESILPWQSRMVYLNLQTYIGRQKIECIKKPSTASRGKWYSHLSLYALLVGE